MLPNTEMSPRAAKTMGSTPCVLTVVEVSMRKDFATKSDTRV